MKIQGSFPLRQSPENKLKEQEGHLREAAKMYENHFMNQMVKSMRSTVHHDDSFMKQNMAEKIFSEQLDQKYVDSWSEKGGVGLADMIYKQIHERLAPTKKDFGKSNQMLPIAPRKENGGLRATDSIQMKMIPTDKTSRMEYRFEVQDPSGSNFEALAPMGGVVKDAQSLGDSWNLVRLDHGQGIESELTFPGQRTDLGIGTELEPGQKLGVLDSKTPVLAWKLDWS